jgi:hypothetical protein
MPPRRKHRINAAEDAAVPGEQQCAFGLEAVQQAWLRCNTN